MDRAVDATRLLGDEAEVFRRFNRPLARMVQRLANTSPDIVDDASCAAALKPRS